MRSPRAEYVIHAKLKNNLVLSRILEKWRTVGEFFRCTGLSAGEVGKYVNLKESALNKDMAWRPSALRLADALGVLPDEIFDDDQRFVALRCNEAMTEIRRRDLLETNGDFTAQLDRRDMVAKLLSHSGLTEREREVVIEYEMNDVSIEVLAERNGVSGCRVRQILNKAIRKMRRSSVASEVVAAGCTD